MWWQSKEIYLFNSVLHVTHETYTIHCVSLILMYRESINGVYMVCFVMVKWFITQNKSKFGKSEIGNTPEASKAAVNLFTFVVTEKLHGHRVYFVIAALEFTVYSQCQ